jgi:predicted MFS family arabinose efflux permease
VVPTLALLRRCDTLTVARWAGLAQAAACWGLAFGLPPLGMAATLFAVGLANAMSTAPKQSLFTLRAPAALRASATSAMFTFALLAGAVGIATGGPAVEAAGATATFAALAALLTVAGIWFAWRTRPDG